MINATYNGQTYQDVTTLVASDGTSNATVTLTESGGGGSVGEYSEYTELRLTPEEAGSIQFTNPYGANTKLITVDASTKPQVGISYFMASQIAGAYKGINAATGTEPNQPAQPYENALGNAVYKFDDTTIIRQCSGNVQWDISTEYIVRIYS